MNAALLALSAAMAMPGTATGSPGLARLDRASPAASGMAFASSPLGDAALGEMHGTGTLPASTTRRMVEDGQLGLLRQAGEASRITFDNWWAQSGAALIAQNMLASGAR